MHLGSLPDNSRGFDANGRITRAVAERFRDAGFTFAVRYVRRATGHAYDLTAGEMADLLAAGLGVMVVQHVAAPGWVPSAALGRAYGAIAAEEARRIGVPIGVTVWCDLEGVARGVPAEEVIGFCNAWHAAVTAALYEPGLYVGDACGLSADQLYRRLRFERYWSAYNLNRDQVPAIRGVQMRQSVASEAERVGVPFEFDVNTIRADRLGGTPVLLLP